MLVGILGPGVQNVFLKQWFGVELQCGREGQCELSNLLCTKPSLFFSLGCIVWSYGYFEDDISYLYPDEEELFEEEDQGSHCGDVYYDRISLYCWPKFHAALMAVDDSSRCLWEMTGSVYGELALCTGLVAAGMGCPMSSPTLNAFFVRIHTEYFTNCSLPSTSAPDHQPGRGTVVMLIFLPVCLVPISVVFILRKV
ncbi:hypothetical protein JRQ81_004747 [Phrynocephalus forsythii]|uniref:Uncharacterized protein n=1 Tax=Phrynocephalus forsythii TaxID=171643 RepID=A0A9Q1AV99_9SAUR|nr:hypothetical protein JRQ81_004747 [Phrynocephalus forsythii]